MLSLFTLSSERKKGAPSTRARAISKDTLALGYPRGEERKGSPQPILSVLLPLGRRGGNGQKF